MSDIKEIAADHYRAGKRAFDASEWATALAEFSAAEEQGHPSVKVGRPLAHLLVAPPPPPPLFTIGSGNRKLVPYSNVCVCARSARVG